MRKINSLSDAQLAVNELLDFKARVLRGGGDNRGNQSKNLADGTDPGDAVTVRQISDFVTANQIPTSVTRQEFRTILWSQQFTTVAGDVIPPYCVVNSDLAGVPFSFWAACITPGTDKPINVNIALVGTEKQIVLGDDGLPVLDEEGNPTYIDAIVYKNLLSEDLTLSVKKQGPVSSGGFISPRPIIGVGSILAPVVTLAGNAQAISFGLVLRREKTETLR